MACPGCWLSLLPLVLLSGCEWVAGYRAVPGSGELDARPLVEAALVDADLAADQPCMSLDFDEGLSGLNTTYGRWEWGASGYVMQQDREVHGAFSLVSGTETLARGPLLATTNLQIAERHTEKTGSAAALAVIVGQPDDGSETYRMVGCTLLWHEDEGYFFSTFACEGAPTCDTKTDVLVSPERFAAPGRITMIIDADNGLSCTLSQDEWAAVVPEPWPAGEVLTEPPMGLGLATFFARARFDRVEACRTE